MKRPLFLSLLAVPAAALLGAEPKAPPPAPVASIVFPMERTAYFIGETIPLAPANVAGDILVEAVNADGRVTLYKGPSAPLWLDTTRFSPGDYALELNGKRVVDRLTLTSTLRRSAASLQDESTPSDKMTPDQTATTLRESGLTACFAMGASDAGRFGVLDTMARTGTMLLVNPETRPTSFFPAGNNPQELDGMSQRMILTAQANARYPNFGGFCFGWDTTGYAIGGRRGLLTYWGWGTKNQALRHYIDRIDAQKMDEFTKRTVFKPVSEEEYLAYVLSIGHPEYGTAIDLPTKAWLDEIARYAKPMPLADRAAFEKRLDDWSGYLMGLYNEAYTAYTRNLRDAAPALRNSSSVQSDHAPVRQGQYFPAAYAPLDFQYQSTWNDQIGGPDYVYQWLLLDALLEMERGNKPTWISSALGTAHGMATVPGKFTRVAAHGLAFGTSGLGFSLEGFSNVLTGMNRATNWQNLKGTAGEADLIAGRDFMDRFSALAVEGKGRHGVGILWSRTQYGRQNVAMGFGRGTYRELVALTRLGYTPRFVTEDELATGRASDVAALIVLGQTCELPPQAAASLAGYIKGGGRVLVDAATTIQIPGAEKLPPMPPPSSLGKPHNWAAPNMAEGENDTILYERTHRAMASAFASALGDTGHAFLRSDLGPDTKVSLLQIDGGSDGAYVVAVNDSYVANQADWHQVREQLSPTPNVPSGGFIYDCTDERLIGKTGPLTCDLSMSTARVFACLSREIKTTELKATQSIKAGDSLIIGVRFLDASARPLAGVLPFHLAVVSPDGTTRSECYRSTLRDGSFSISLPIAANAPTGLWSVQVRSQLTGDLATLPVTVAPAAALPLAVAMTDGVIVRDRADIQKMLSKGATVVLPLFDDKLLPVAQKVKETLASQGVDVEIRQNPVLNAYTISYEPTEAQLLENARDDRGEAIGKLNCETLNRNDWASALVPWHFGKPVILLDLVGDPSPNPMAASLSTCGILWPLATQAFPGAGHAVVQDVPWAFAPRTTALIIQAVDIDGLMAGAKSLASLPDDRITPAIVATTSALWQQYHIGSRPTPPQAAGLSAQNLFVAREPKPFAIAFPGGLPPTAEQVKHPQGVTRAALDVPGQFLPKQLVICYVVDNHVIETSTVEPLMADLRFSQALKLVADVKTPGKMKLKATGVFRYSDRKPCWQAQWEDVINLRDRLVPKERRPMEIDVQIDGKSVGRMIPTAVAETEVMVEMGPAPKKAKEETVTEMSCDIELSAGRQEIVFIPHDIVDGKLKTLGVAP